MIAGVLTANELALLRTRPQRTLLYLATPAYKTIYTARTDGALAVNDKVTSVDFDGGVGTLTDIEPGMTLLVGTSAGAWDVGIARIRANSFDGGGGTGFLFIGITSEIEWSDDLYLTVIDDIGLWPRHPYVSAAVTYMDYGIAYTNQNEAGPPVPIMGTHAVLELTGATVTATFDASDSYSCIGTPASYDYAWYVDGVLVSNADAVTISFSAVGTYLIKLEVTANYSFCTAGPESVSYRYVIVHDCEHPLNSSFMLDSCSGSFSGGGWSYRVTMNASAGEAYIRDRTLCLLVAEDWYGDTKDSIGPLDGRENIICVGWVDGESVRRSNDKSMVSFEVQGPGFWLGVQEGFPTGIDDTNAAPVDWNHIQALDPRKGLFSFLHWRTTSTMVMDCYITNDDHRLATTYTPAGTLLEQLRAIIERINGYTVCDRYGRLFCEIDTQFIEPASRTFAVVQTLSDKDWRDEITIERRTVGECGQVDLSGIYYSGDLATSSAIFSLSPGHIPTHYGEKRQIERIALDDQAEANTLAGLWLGYLNNEFPHIDIPMSSNHRGIDVAPRMFVQMNLAASDTPRGLVWTNKKLIPREVSFNYDARQAMLLTDVTFEAETFASDAVTGDPPIEPPDPPTTTAPVPPPICDDATALNYGGPAPCVYAPPIVPMVIVLNQSQLARTYNFDEASPNWESIKGAITGLLYNIKQIPGTLEAWVSADSGIWYCGNIDAVAPAWSLIHSQADLLTLSGLSTIPTTRFKALDTAGGDCYLAPNEHGATAITWGYFVGGSGGLTWTLFPAAPHYQCLDYGSHNIYADGGPYIGVGAGPGGAALYDGAGFISFAGQYAIGATNGGFVISHDTHLYGPGWAFALYDAVNHRSPGFGLDTISGGSPLAMAATLASLYRDNTEITTVLVTMGASILGGRAIYRPGGDADSIIWVAASGVTVWSTTRFIVSTNDGFATYSDKRGDWFATIGAWAGSSGSSGADGNALAIELY